MKVFSSKSINYSKILIFLNPLVFSLLAQAGTVDISLNQLKTPPTNLVDHQNKMLYFSDIVKMYNNKQDISDFNPIEDKFWQNKKYSAVDIQLHEKFPKNEVDYDDYIGSTRELQMVSFNVKDPKTNQRYIMSIGNEIFASLTKSALLRKLGYIQQSPKFYKTLKVNFKSKEDREAFVQQAFCIKGPSEVAQDCLLIEPFKSEANPREYLKREGERSLIVNTSYLEQLNPEIYSLFDGFLPAVGDLLSYFSQSRQIRALIVPYIIGDLKENINKYSPYVGIVRNKKLILNYSFAGDFKEVDLHDVRWILKRMAQWSEKDWDDVIEASQIDKDLKALVKSKMILRFKNLIELTFGKDKLNQYFKLNVVDPTSINVAGLIDKGRIVVPLVKDYPQEFAGQPRKAFFDTKDLIQFLKIDLQSEVIGLAVQKLNKELEEYYNGGFKVDKSTIEKFKLTDTGFKVLRKAKATQKGLNAYATRFITTGTFYGSQAPLQLVDNVGVSGSYSRLRLVDRYSELQEFLSANVSINRDYTHVRPLDKMDESKDYSFKNMFIPTQLLTLTSPLKNGKILDFAKNLKNGEVFTITDSLGAAVNVGIENILADLVQISKSTVATTGLSASADKVILRQIQILKTPSGFQVFVRDLKNTNLGLEANANYFLNLAKLSVQDQNSKVKTDAFMLHLNIDSASSEIPLVTQKTSDVSTVISGAAQNTSVVSSPNEITPDDPTQEEQAPQESEEAKQARLKKETEDKLVSRALRGLLIYSNSDLLYQNFKDKQFIINHKLDAKETKLSFFHKRATSMNETHIMNLFKPVLNPAVDGEVKNEPIEIAVSKKGELVGTDTFNFGLGIIDAILKKKLKDNAISLSKSVQNPSLMPFGKAQWHVVRIDSETTQSRPGALPTVGIIQNVWGGWKLKKADLLEIINIVNKKIENSQLHQYKVIPDAALYQVDEIDFFRVTENVSLLPGAIKKIIELVIDPEVVSGAEIKPDHFLERLRWKLSQLGKNNKQRPQDKVIYNNILEMMGNGDEVKGRELYVAQCRANALKQVPLNSKVHVPTNINTYSYGTKFECLEPWVNSILTLARKYSKASVITRNEILRDIIYELEKNIPTQALLNSIGEENYIYFPEIVGFRVGDYDGQNGIFIGNSYGTPKERNPYSNGLISVLADENVTGINMVELDRSLTSF